MGWGRWSAAGAAALLAIVSIAPASGAEVSDEDEIRCLALNVYHEARGESLEGRMAVAAVTLNRVRHASYPDTVCGVVWQRGQFSWTRDGRPDRPYERKAWAESKRIARRAYEAGTVPDLERVIYFHSDVVRPRWAHERVRVAKLGRHVFYR